MRNAHYSGGEPPCFALAAEARRAESVPGRATTAVNGQARHTDLRNGHSTDLDMCMCVFCTFETFSK